MMGPSSSLRRHRARHVARAAGLVAGAAIATMLLGVAAGPAAASGGSATVTGTVELGKAPVAGATVWLIADASTANRPVQTRSDAHGRFAFPGLASGSDISYTVLTEYRGAQFATDAITLTAGGTSNVTLDVYPNTVSPAAVTVSAWTVWLDFPSGHLAVQQDVTYQNDGTAAYRGSTPIQTPIGAATGSVLLPVALGGGTFEYLGRFQSCCSAAAPGTWTQSRAIAPGTSTGTVRYESPKVGTLSFPAQFAVKSFVILAPAGTSLSSPLLTAAGSESDRGTTYQVYRAGPLAAGQVLTINVGAPPRNWGPVLWASAGAGIPVIALIAWLLIRRRRRAVEVPTEPEPRDRTKTRGRRERSTIAESKGARVHPVPVRAATSGQRDSQGGPVDAAIGTESDGHGPAARPGRRGSGAANQRVVNNAPVESNGNSTQSDPAQLADELARLDLAFENGTLADEVTYQQIREALIARLVSAVAADPAGLH